MACAYLLTCKDADEVLLAMKESGFIYPNDEPGSDQARTALLNILLYLRERLQSDKPWKITEDFIADLGGKFVWFKTVNSVFLAQFKRTGCSFPSISFCTYTEHSVRKFFCTRTSP